jgi:hypothetical protein
MNLFFLIGDKGDRGGRFLEDVIPLIPKDRLEVFLGFTGFAERLRKPRDPFGALVLLGPSHEDLRRVISLRDFLKDTKVLLVLGDQNEETISLAHKILPTYISYLDNGTSGVVSVLKQLMKDAPSRAEAQ